MGAVADNFDEKIEQKIFHAQIVVDNERVKRETAAYVPIPEISSFMGADGQDHMKEIIQANYERIRADVERIVKTEMKRIEDDPELCKLIPKPKQQAAKEPRFTAFRRPCPAPDGRAVSSAPKPGILACG